MLVLSRKKNESIIINDNVVVTVVDVRGDKIRLGIQAPPHIPIHRSEVQQAIEEKRNAQEKTMEGEGSASQQQKGHVG